MCNKIRFSVYAYTFWPWKRQRCFLKGVRLLKTVSYEIFHVQWNLEIGSKYENSETFYILRNGFNFSLGGVHKHLFNVVKNAPVGNLTGKEKSFSTKKMHDFYLNLVVRVVLFSSLGNKMKCLKWMIYIEKLSWG